MNEIRTGTVSIQSVELIRDYTTTPVSLNNIFLELNLFEDIYSDSVSGNILVVDTSNIVSNYPVRGTEFLKIKMMSDVTSIVIDKIFRIYEISERRQLSPGQIVYIINFISIEKVMNSDFIISQSFSRTTTSDVVKDVWKQFLEHYNSKHAVVYPTSHLPKANLNYINSFIGGQNSFVSDNESFDVFNNNNMFNIEVQKTKYISDFIIPGWCVYSTIHWLASRSVAENKKGSNFLFFETLEGFKFVSLESLYVSGKERLSVDNTRIYNFTGVPQTADEFQSMMGQRYISSFNVVQSPNLIENVKMGMYSSKMIQHDLLRRSYDIIEFDYRQSYLDSINYKHTYRNVYPHVHLNDFPLAEVDVAVNNYDSSSHTFYQTKPENDDYSYLWKQSRISQLQQLENVKLELTLDGYIDIYAGQVVQVNIGDARAGGSNELDPLYSGNYIVTGLRHKIDKNKYEVVMEVSKDSF